MHGQTRHPQPFVIVRGAQTAWLSVAAVKNDLSNRFIPKTLENMDAKPNSCCHDWRSDRRCRVTLDRQRHGIELFVVGHNRLRIEPAGLHALGSAQGHQPVGVQYGRSQSSILSTRRRKHCLSRQQQNSWRQFLFYGSVSTLRPACLSVDGESARRQRQGFGNGFRFAAVSAAISAWRVRHNSIRGHFNGSSSRRVSAVSTWYRADQGQ